MWKIRIRETWAPKDTNREPEIRFSFAAEKHLYQGKKNLLKTEKTIEDGPENGNFNKQNDNKIDAVRDNSFPKWRYSVNIMITWKWEKIHW